MKFGKKEVHFSRFAFPLAMVIFVSFLASLKEMFFQCLYNKTIEERINATTPIYNSYTLMERSSDYALAILGICAVVLVVKSAIDFINELTPSQRSDKNDSQDNDGETINGPDR